MLQEKKRLVPTKTVPGPADFKNRRVHIGVESLEAAKSLNYLQANLVMVGRFHAYADPESIANEAKSRKFTAHRIHYMRYPLDKAEICLRQDNNP